MNGYLVIALFTVILAATVYWLQGRQVKMDTSRPKEVPKKIEVVKASDWDVKEPEEKEPEPKSVEVEDTEPDQVEEEPELDESLEEIPEEVVVDVSEEQVDISKLSGVGPKYRNLLKEAGITTVNQVAKQTPGELLTLLLETNEKTGITKRPPTMSNVQAWVEAAKAMLG